MTSRPGGVSGYRAFEPRRVHTLGNLQIDLLKAREHESAIYSMNNRRAVLVLNPVRDIN